MKGTYSSGMAAALFTVALVCLTLNAQTVNPPSDSPGEAELRRMVSTQPDYRGVMRFMFDEGHGGFGATSKVARLGGRFREEDEDRIIISEPGRPDLRIYPKRKEYAEVPETKVKGEFAVTPEQLAARGDVTFKALGLEKVDGHSCQKMEVEYKDARLKGLKFVFCAAPEFDNLVVWQQVFMEPVTMTTVLTDVTLGASEELFSIPAGYKKIIEKSYEEEMKELLDGIKTPARRPRKRRGARD